MLKKLFICLTVLMLLPFHSAFALQDGTWGIGSGLYSHNSFNAITKSETASTSFLGTNYFPLIFSYELQFLGDWYFKPKLFYTLLPVSTPDNVDTSFMLLDFAVGRNFATGWDWTAGLGIFRYTISGAGGSTVLNNGGSTATFGRPGRDVTTQQLLLTLTPGYAVSFGNVNFALNMTSPTADRVEKSILFGFQYNLGKN